MVSQKPQNQQKFSPLDYMVSNKIEIFKPGTRWPVASACLFFLKLSLFHEVSVCSPQNY